MIANKMLITAALASIVIASIITISALQTTTTAQQEMMAHHTVTVNLDYQRVRPGQFVHLMDTTPHPIVSGHVAIHIDCNDEGVAPLEVAVGVAPEMENIKLNMKNMIHMMSEHGVMCLYHFDLPPKEGMVITDIALVNTSDKWVRLGPEATGLVHVHSLSHESVEGEHGMDHSMEGM